VTVALAVEVAVELSVGRADAVGRTVDEGSAEKEGKAV
jgi:hypothetical protein